MNRIRFNRTNLDVSPICLGTVNYGSSMADDDALRQMSQFVDLGGNFIDTARIYGVWAGRGEALSERVIGRWLKETGNRQRVVIATKGCHPEWDALNVMRVKPQDIRRDLDESLTHLGTDVIDLYFLHRDDPDVPVADILGALDDARSAGKIRHYGCSNWTLPRVVEAEMMARRERYEGFICNQLMWSLADIRFDGLADKTFVLMDKATHDYHESTGMNAMAYMSIAKGYFMRRMMGEILPPEVNAVYENPGNERIYQRMRELAGDPALTPLNLSLSYLMMQPFPSVPIASFDDAAQLKEALNCCEDPVDAATLKQFDAMKSFIW